MRHTNGLAEKSVTPFDGVLRKLRNVLSALYNLDVQLLLLPDPVSNGLEHRES
jgi:hypothetical protein